MGGYTLTSPCRLDGIDTDLFLPQVGLEDADLHAMLTRLWLAGRLKDTVLVMMADHGHRFAEFRNTLQGKLEERLPYFAWVLPEEFQTRYPQVCWAPHHHSNTDQHVQVLPAP